MSRTIVDIHVLQTVPPSNINRDDTGSPKTAVFGGVRRARVSSQAWKRATRQAFKDLLDRGDLGVRTKRLVEIVAKRILELNPELSENATALAEAIVASTGISLEKVKRKTNKAEVENQEAKYLVFLSDLQVNLLAEKAIELAPDGDAAAIKGFKGKALLDTANSVDLSLFGRMVADVSDLNVDASAQVAHAISVHQVDNEYDYFTAVDDVKNAAEDEDAGAGMIGTVEFNSSTLYRYATVNIDGLRKNLGDDLATRRAIEAFVKAFVESMPTGKQNTFANRTLPDAVVVTVRENQPINLVGAFEDPVVRTEDRTRLRIAAERLAHRAIDVEDTLGQVPVATWIVAFGDAKLGLQTPVAGSDRKLDATWVALPELSHAVGALVADRLGDPQ